MTDAPANAEIRAAGAVLWRPSGRGREVAVVHRRRYDDWSFPKGKRERGEHVLLTAVREVAEETGLRVILGRPLPAALYERDGRPKRVDYWAGRPAVGGRASFRPNDEVDELAWLPLPSARGRLSYPRDAVTLDDFAAGPADTVPFVLLRHASAVSKDSWPGEDRERPLDARGAEESERLAHLLACFGSSRVISSPAERCVATVRPYATLTGANLEIETVLGADQADDEPGAGSARVAAIVAAGRPAVICGHRENLPVLLAAACAALGTSPPSDHPLRPAGFWVLHTADGVLAAAEYHHPAGPLPAAPPYPASNTRFCRATASKYLLPMARIAELICYPVKGCAGTPAPDGALMPAGLAHDRSLMVVNDDGVFRSQRRDPRLALVRPEVSLGGQRLTLRAPGVGDIAVDVDLTAARRDVAMFGVPYQGIDQGDAVAGWLSDVLGQRSRLVRVPPEHRRVTDGQTPGTAGYADSSSLLVISRSSLDLLNERIMVRGGLWLPMDRFRPNVVVAGWERPHTEDRVRRASVGSAEIGYAKLAIRCAVTLVDQQTGTRAGPEPVRTLAGYRRAVQGGVAFGAKFSVLRPGKLSVGDKILITSWGESEL